MSLLSGLRSQIEQLLALAQQSYELLKPEIDLHLASDSPDVEAIDHLLDHLYPAYSMGKDEGTYRALVAKLAAVDPEAAAFYEECILEETNDAGACCVSPNHAAQSNR
ncbi:MAG: hypothetical protein NW241_11025 [Bacteroidia bacterium]|nr:hypothetical protein [Bacteroidia bacterium]